MPEAGVQAHGRVRGLLISARPSFPSAWSACAWLAVSGQSADRASCSTKGNTNVSEV